MREEKWTIEEREGLDAHDWMDGVLSELLEMAKMGQRPGASYIHSRKESSNILS